MNNRRPTPPSRAAVLEMMKSIEFGSIRGSKVKPLMKPRGIVIHHSLTKDSETKSWDAIRRYHVETMGWQDIGYHYGIEDIDGALVIIDGRPTGKIGAHTSGFNDSIGICLVGNYDVDEVDPARLELLTTLVLQVLIFYPHLSPADVFPHNHFADYKSCPGKKFPWDAFINNIWERWAGP